MAASRRPASRPRGSCGRRPARFVGSRNTGCASCVWRPRLRPLQQRKRRICPTRWESMLGPRRRLGCPPVPPGRTKRVVRRYYEDVLIDRRLDVLRELLAPEFVGHDSAGATIDRAGYIAGVRELLSAFGELSISIDD